ncbi:ELKS/Rab6-interacting/CAST family protein [Virgibacillus halodenitrificans]|uniref:ELKS/Rab6-interacting/CAST family protein n=1 Tax=Virgibacillus halodenitrificans TaxID=1482 RepID=UPI001F343920|nr:ELKS/Rab6-interacting/CAST family protein [Virgibacillus halodenitrificans]
MTAEVAIMNKLGMALAADSAITSGRDGVQKVYNSANKLFSLSKHHSVGIMVYGAASFMEVPWDIIIKSYREYLGDKKFDNLSYYFEDFLDFLQQDNRFGREDIEHIIVYRTFSDILKRLVRGVEEEVSSLDDTSEITTILTETVKKQLNDYKQKEDWLKLDYTTFQQSFNTVVTEVREEFIVYKTPGELNALLSELAFEVTKSDYFSLGSTGIVFCGYGEKEIFPHLLNYRLEGFVNGQLKYKKLKDKEISYTSDKKAGTAAILPFAQREMVDSFMYGIEPTMEDTIFGIVEEVLTNYHEQIKKHLNIDLTDEQVKETMRLGNEMYESIQSSVNEYQQSNYIEPLLGVVRSLPKEELAEMAEALVNLTSFKRRVTRATESVGPPIDVAVITKGDGFIWMKRKNYVNSEINAF